MEHRKLFMGIDVGSVSTNIIFIDQKETIVEKLYIRTQGQPIKALQEGLKIMKKRLLPEDKVIGVGTTGSGRNLANMIVGADVVKNEITAHGIAGLKEREDVSTILEIGGQDSKIIILRNGIIQDFAMNTVCAAGTGSFLDRQASRLNIPIEEFGKMALKSKNSIRIAGRCAVFAESDMIHKQQMGHNNKDIIKGLCEALVRNYLSNVGKGKEIEPPILFQGGVAANIGIKQAFEEALQQEVIVPKYFDVMGAYGVAILAKENWEKTHKTNFYGFDIVNTALQIKSFDCKDCANQCEVIYFLSNGKIRARWGDRCGKWSNLKKTTENLLA
ncbi:acyl-CoA dehydratase activase [Garciella nitratireducens]|uniref:CoA-substrate-specific enzyme activase, putative n=1 Tax=Garciella nitratireducens DSM 15102 TaxID=1121911 RepID=A0A1T4JSB1_9FIRM|nr:acyl-CoA dehydratase activase [Garciella nitratireducens]SJZ33031.1 CoA-substrate-specific enzyme activase, putative [Garciella nitratireducens DSM 15102]